MVIIILAPSFASNSSNSPRVFVLFCFVLFCFVLFCFVFLVEEEEVLLYEFEVLMQPCAVQTGTKARATHPFLAILPFRSTLLEL